jgi:hypothetical protein
MAWAAAATSCPRPISAAEFGEGGRRLRAHAHQRADGGAAQRPAGSGNREAAPRAGRRVARLAEDLVAPAVEHVRLKPSRRRPRSPSVRFQTVTASIGELAAQIDFPPRVPVVLRGVGLGAAPKLPSVRPSMARAASPPFEVLD